MKRLTIAVSGINIVDNPGSGYGIIRSLREANSKYRCIGLSYDAMDPGLYLDNFISKGYLLPYPSSSIEKYLDRLMYICGKEKVNIIIPAFDSELPHYIKNYNLLKKRDIRLIVPTREQFESCNKANLAHLAERIKIRVPLTFSVSTFEELNRALENVGFPAIVKGCFYEAYRVSSYYEAHNYFDQLSKKWGFPVLVQQFITGNDYNLVGLGSKDGECLGLVAAKKLLLTQLGKIWTAVTIDNPRMIGVGKKFIEVTHFRGGFELEFRMTPKEELYLLEINPRFPAWVYLATAVGINLPHRYVLNLTEGKKKFRMGYKPGRLLIRYTGEIIKNITDFENITIKGESL
ncbi:MAG: ATP-grasp domain-containing protein [Candidatus Hydrogenedentota bacterium]